MDSQKLENLLNLALNSSMEERDKSLELNVGYDSLNQRWELIVKYNGDLSRLNGPVIQVEELIAGYAIVTIPQGLIDSFVELDEIEYVEKPKRLFFSLLRGKEASCIPPVTARPPYLTGRDVIVAVIDSGIDYESMDFRNRDGSSRILYLWDQTLIPDTENGLLSPNGFTTGVEFDNAQINRALEETDAEQRRRLLPSSDISGHGTAVAQIAAGNGLSSDVRYEGVAPESNLIIVKLGSADKQQSFPRTTELMRALTYVVHKSTELFSPLAINLSFGNTYGAHDGTSLLEHFIDNLSEIGRNVICAGSGNEGSAGGHTAGTITEPVLVELAVASYEKTVNVQLWKEYADIFRIVLISPGGQRQSIDTGRPGTARITMEQTEILIYVGEPSPYSVNQEIYFDFLPSESYVNQGIWSFRLEPVKIVTGNYYFYLPSSVVLNSGTRFFSPTPEVTFTIPSTASKLITVGAYDPVYDSYADFSGRGYLLLNQLESRAAGEVVKPDIAAPGVNLALSDGRGGMLNVSGTSFAAPFATGSAALMMEWGIIQGNDPYLFGEKVKAYMRRGARALRGETEYPNARVGYGALCVADSLPI